MSSSTINYKAYTNLIEDSFKSIEPTPLRTLGFKFLGYNPTLKIIICRECKTALLRSDLIYRHLKDYHLSIYIPKDISFLS